LHSPRVKYRDTVIGLRRRVSSCPALRASPRVRTTTKNLRKRPSPCQNLRPPSSPRNFPATNGLLRISTKSTRRISLLWMKNGPRSSPVNKLQNLRAQRRRKRQSKPRHQQNPHSLNLQNHRPQRSKRLKSPNPPHHQMRRQNRLNQKFDTQ